jgi:hypothetical protein
MLNPGPALFKMECGFPGGRTMRKKLAAICLSATLLGCTSSSGPGTADTLKEATSESDIQQALVGKPAGQALDHFNVGFDDLQMYLQRWEFRAVSIERKKGDHTLRVFLWLDGKGTEWPTGTFDIDTIRNVKVTEITTEEIDVEKSFEGKLAGEALDYYRVGFNDLSMTDEPSGHLDAVSFAVKMGDHTHRIYLNLEGDVCQFREDLDWDIESIRKAKIVSITTKWPGGFCGEVGSRK